MHSWTRARGVRGHVPPKIFGKNGAFWCNLGVPKYAITKLKISNFKVNKSTTTEVDWHIFPPEVNLDVHVIRKLIHLEFTRGVCGAIPPEAEENLKNQTKWRLFLYFYFFLLFGRAP